MTKINPKIIMIIFVVLLLLVGFLLYQGQKRNAVEEAETRIEIFMKKWHALFDYIEIEQKSVFYALEKEGSLTIDGYFDPKVLSFTYIARHIQHKYEQLEKANGNIPYRYRLAATTPRNPINQATKHEAEILEQFRNNEITKFTEYTFFEGEKYFTSYSPISRTTETCMRCHSTPDKAPKGLVELYGKELGFNETLGQIRGMVITEIPFKQIEADAFKHYIQSMVLISLFFVSFAVTINALIKKERILNRSNAELERLSNTDNLTNIANRRSFTNYLQQQWIIHNKQKKNISLILCQIDYFDLYNDNQNSEKCLIQVTQAITPCIRKENSLFARYEGATFSILLPDSNNEEVVQLAETIQREVSKIDLSPAISLSIGICTICPNSSMSHEELIKKTAYLLSKAQNDGRNCIRG